MSSESKGVEQVFADANLFLRYLTNDLPDQAEAFDHVLRRAGRGELILVTNSLVISEIVWTLESYYKLVRPEIQDKVLAMLNTPGLEIDQGDLTLQAIYWYVEKNMDFIDAFNVAWMLKRGMDTACTFDRKHFTRIEGIKVWTPG